MPTDTPLQKVTFGKEEETGNVVGNYLSRVCVCVCLALASDWLTPEDVTGESKSVTDRLTSENIPFRSQYHGAG